MHYEIIHSNAAFYDYYRFYAGIPIRYDIIIRCIFQLGQSVHMLELDTHFRMLMPRHSIDCINLYCISCILCGESYNIIRIYYVNVRSMRMRNGDSSVLYWFFLYWYFPFTNLPFHVLYTFLKHKIHKAAVNRMWVVWSGNIKIYIIIYIYINS